MITILPVDIKDKVNSCILKVEDKGVIIGYILLDININVVEIIDIIIFTEEIGKEYIDSMIKSIINYALNRNKFIITYDKQREVVSNYLVDFGFEEKIGKLSFNIALNLNKCRCSECR